MAAADSVVLFVVDGMRPDGMLQASAPTLHRLVAQGASTLTARTVMPSISLPTHMSMFHGVRPELHGVVTNDYRPMPGGEIPGIIELVRQAKRRPVAFTTWDPLRDLSRPGMLVYSSFIDIYGPDGQDSDQDIAGLAAGYLAQHPADFAFIYLGWTDEIGHRSGWMSPEYLEAIAAADAAIACVLGGLESASRLEHTAVVVTADHGGHDHGHGTDAPEDMTVPWVLAGAGIKQGYQIGGPVSIIDLAPTIAYLLDLPIPPEWQGKPAIEVVQ